MERSNTRILTTHAGSLPRPPKLLDLLVSLSKREPVDEASLAAEVDAVTPADLARLTGRILGERRAAVAVLGPKAALKAAPAFEAALFG